MIEDINRSWELKPDWESRRGFIFGDAKTIENMFKFIRDMQDRRITYLADNVQADIFLKALTVVMDIPGDWHAGLE